MSRYKIVASTCLKHVDDNVTAFCSKHNKPLCLKCVLDEHAACVAEKHVKDIKTSIEECERVIPNMLSYCDYLTDTVDQLSEKTNTCIDNIDKSEETIVTGIEQLKNDLINKIEDLYNESLEMVKAVIDEQKLVVQNDHVAVEALVGTIKESKGVFDRLTNGDEVSIAEVNSMMTHVKDMEMNGTNRCEKNILFTFKVSDEVDYIKKHLHSLGELCHNQFKDKTDENSTLGSETNNLDDVNDRSTYSHRSADFIQSLSSDGLPVCLPHDGYVVIDQVNAKGILPPPLPCSHPPKLSLNLSNSNQELKQMNNLRPQSSVRRTDSKPICESMKGDSISDRPKLAMPELPKRRLSKMRKPTTKPFDNDVDDTSGATRRNSSIYHTIICEPLTPEPIIDEVVAIDTKECGKSLSNSFMADSTLDIAKSATSLDSSWKVKHKTVERLKSQSPILRSAMSNVKSTIEHTALTPPKSHTFMWSDNGVTRSSSSASSNNKDSGINMSWPTAGLIAKHSSLLSLQERSSTGGRQRMEFIPTRNVHTDVFNDFDENLKSLSHSDLPNLNLDLPPLIRTSSEQTVDADNDGSDGLDVLDFQTGGNFQNLGNTGKRYSPCATMSSDSLSVKSCDGLDKHLQNMKLCECSNDDKHSPIHQHVREGSMMSVDSISSPSKPCVVKEKRSDQCRLFKLPDINDIPGQTGNHHSTVTGIALTDSGHLLVCDFENNSVQHYNASGTLVSDCSVPEPISCCYIKDELVAVCSKKKKTLTIFELSESTMSFKQDVRISLVMEVFGVAYADGFFAISCRDQVLLYTEHLKPYCEVKPLMVSDKKRSKPYFSDVRYVAMEIRDKTRIYTCEHHVNRISCISVDRTLRYRKEWESKIGKPRSIVLYEECLLVAAKSKIVVLDSAHGLRMREIHNDIPAHPVHIVVHDKWLFVTKSSTSNSESRTIRKLRL